MSLRQSTGEFAALDVEHLHQAEIQQLGNVGDAAPLAQNDVARLHVAVDQADAVGFA